MSFQRALAGAVAALLAAGLPVISAAPAQAAGTITTQWYVKPTGLAELKAKGLDGSGLKIAIIDAAPPDLTVPELKGANVKVVSPCKDKPKKAWIEHSTAVTSILASPDYGWAPKAEYTVYVRVPKLSDDMTDRSCVKKQADTGAYLINQALNDGADLITIQVGEMGSIGGYELVRAALKGVPVVAAAGNNGKDYTYGTEGMNTSVGVGAVDTRNKHAKFSSWGDAITVVAPGVKISTRRYGADGRLSAVEKSQGTSFSAPIVAGALALAMQAWPEANGNQLERTLIATADRAGEEHDPYLGWGVLDARELVATDPSGQSTENPLLDKDPEESPTTQEFADYRDGITDTFYILNDDDYVYRGDDQLICEDAPRCELGTSPRLHPSASASPSQPSASPVTSAPSTPAPAPGGPSAVIPIAAGVAALVLLGAATGVGVMLSRRRKAALPAENDRTR